MENIQYYKHLRNKVNGMIPKDTHNDKFKKFNQTSKSNSQTKWKLIKK